MPKALDTLLLGLHGEVHAGDEIPATYINSVGVEEATDFERLAVLGLVASTDAVEEDPDAEIVDGLKVADYEAGNATQIAALVSEAPLQTAKAVLEYELAHEKRKTVTRAAEARIAKLEVEPPAEPPADEQE